MQKTRVLLADGHRSFVEALGMRLAAEPDLEVVGVVVEPDDAVRIATAHPVDVALLAVEGSSAFITVARRLLEIRPETKLIGVAGVDDVALLARAVRAGFRGWVPKELGVGVLLEVVQTVRRGEAWIPPADLGRLLSHLLEENDQRREAEKPLSLLTVREREVLKAMASGAGRQEIALQLSISSNTVRTHMQSILTKLGVHSSLAAVTVARRAGIT